MFNIKKAIEEIKNNFNNTSFSSFDKRKVFDSDFISLKKEKCNITAGASDSGFGEIGLRGGSIFLLKKIGVIFSYTDGKLSDHSYIPNKLGIREYFIVPNLDDTESRLFIEIKRLDAEWEMLSRTIEKGCEIAFFDGSIVPLPSVVSKKGTILFDEYEKLIKRIRETKDLAINKKTIIVGVIKDSRSSKICEKLNIKSNDSLLMENILKDGEATPPLNYSEERKDVLFSYLKTGKNFVFRIEWFSDYLETPLQKIYTLCNISGYKYPPPLVEADLRAMLRKTEFEAVERSIRSALPNLTKIREKRPFR